MRLSPVSPKDSTGHSTVSSLYIRRFHGKYAFICPLAGMFYNDYT
ncbi:hypothetical protein ANACOL_03492 [Anaerotruncus colihominis DSM 17241]|uniref:Uncharacterized protein n=1 Tax=Anaerotruncus colihominis DSM 17241 TaxID=445972 RepID=B0PFB4_9FIRM|nr:hypothetical protein ANACOL_03492 [Anaerotruncus colihominis DSM 17241]